MSYVDSQTHIAKVYNVQLEPNLALPLIFNTSFRYQHITSLITLYIIYLQFIRSLLNSQQFLEFFLKFIAMSNYQYTFCLSLCNSLAWHLKPYNCTHILFKTKTTHFSDQNVWGITPNGTPQHRPMAATAQLTMCRILNLC